MAEADDQRAIGRLEGKLDALISKVETQATASDESRRRLYERVGRIETAIELSGKAETQISERLAAIDRRIDEEVMPTVNEVNGWKKMGIGALFIIGIGGAAVGSAGLWVLHNIKWPWEA